MRKLTFVLATILTTATTPAWAAGVPGTVAPDPTAEPVPDAKPTSERLEQRHVSARRFERAEMREEIRKDEAAAERRRAAQPAPVPPHLQAIAQCESGGDPSAIGGGGAFRGKYQFTFETWAAVGGSGDPAQAPEAEQDRRAATLYETSGAGQWPVCGQ